MYAALGWFLYKQPAWNSWSRWYFYVIIGGVFLMVIMGTWAGAVAARKGRRMQGWFLIGFCIPVIGLALSYVVKPLGTRAQKTEGVGGQTKKE